MEQSYLSNSNQSSNKQGRNGFGKNLFLDSNTQQQTGKIQPQAVEIEEAVLGALMIEKDALTNVVDILQESSFYKEAHQ
jgi:replicative DNA helicase